MQNSAAWLFYLPNITPYSCYINPIIPPDQAKGLYQALRGHMTLFQHYPEIMRSPLTARTITGRKFTRLQVVFHNAINGKDSRTPGPYLRGKQARPPAPGPPERVYCTSHRPSVVIPEDTHTATAAAGEWGLLSRNPTYAVRPPRVERMEMHTLNEDDMIRLLEAAKGSSYYALFYMALFTGMRRSELLALRWQDIDLLLSQIYVNRSLHVLKGGQVVFKPPKTTAGRRTVALPPSAILLLKAYKEKQELERGSLGTSLTDNDLVFRHFDGKPLLPNTVTHAWINLVRRTGLKGIRPMTLATRMPA